MLRSIIRITCALTSICTIVACAGKKPDSAEDHYAIANDHLQAGAYSMAIKSYRELLDQHPFSELAEDAELRIAQAHYQNRACPEAIAAFSDFQRRHPTSPHLPLVGFQIGRCHEKQMKKPDRDQSASQSAHAYYQAVINQFPDSPFADLSQERLEHCREALAQHELNIAYFYLKTGLDKAGEIRLIDLVKRYNDTDQAAEALHRLSEIYRQREEDDKATLALSALLYHHTEHNLAGAADEELASLIEDGERPLGDPLAALLSRSGRWRNIETSSDTDSELAGVKQLPSGRPNVGFNRPNYDPIETSRPNRRY